MAKYYVLIVYGQNDAFVLNLDGYATRVLAQRAIDWQKVGSGQSDRHEICIRTGPATFQNDNGTYTSCRGCRTTEAWKEFLDQWVEPQVAPSGAA